jgi:diguanylate cyclase (GGDEF)-like protein/PAS domain S-box-containing protein
VNDAIARVLLVDDDTESDRPLRLILGGQHIHRFDVTHAPRVTDAAARLEQDAYDVVLLSLTTAPPSGLAALALLQAAAPDVPILVIAPSAQEGLALKAVQHGAVDYLITEQVYDTVLVRAVRHAIESCRAQLERASAEQALRLSELRYRSIFEQSHDAIFILDERLLILEANSAALYLFGYDEEEMVGMPLGILYDEPDRARVLLDELRDSGRSPELEVRMRRRDGAPLYCLLSVAERADSRGTLIGYQGIAHDITDRKLAEERLVHSAFHDALTGLPNRALFSDRLEVALAHWRRSEDRRCAVLFIDLDRFKVVNDSLGHAVGDAFLRHVAGELAACMREEDTVARMGGDEFAVLLDHVQHEGDAVRAAERIQRRLARTFVVEGRQMFTSASIGIALAESRDQGAHDLLRNADIAMYRAKTAGPARHVVFSPAEDNSAVDMLTLETELRQALARDEFVLHYQPILSLHDRSIRGFEALVRWRHPRRGLLAPQEFIPLAEETGLIVPLGCWVLRRACSDAMTLLPNGSHELRPYVAVNLSSRQLERSDLVEEVVAAFAETGLPPSRLSLEITESMLIRNAAVAASSLAALRSLGVRICIDDFGTGYSSLAHLNTFQLDELKIDRSFISRLHTSPQCAELVHTMLSLADRLGISTVAEGVENTEQLAHLERLGAASVQGFYFSVPLAVEAAAELLGRTSATSWPETAAE